MKKFIQVFKISFAQEFAYRANFIMWRVRNIFQIFLVFFVWDAVFSNSGKVLFGYDRARMLTYVFGILIVRAFVFSARTVDVAGEIANGEIVNFLVKPINYFKYWLTRDIASKTLNLSFAIIEAFLLYLILKPPFFIQTGFFYNFGFLLSLAIAMSIFFLLVFIVSTVPFWMPESAWGAQFLIIVVITEFLSGALFPLDILPNVLQNILNFLPFPYLIFFPLQIYLGKLGLIQTVKGILIGSIWIFILWYLLNRVWQKGLAVYESYGR